MAEVAGTVRGGVEGPRFNQAVLVTGSCLLQNRKRVDVPSGNVVVDIVGQAWKRVAFAVPFDLIMLNGDWLQMQRKAQCSFHGCSCDMLCSEFVAWASAFMANHVDTAPTVLQEVTTKTSVQQKTPIHV
jgi:hypothetical protein